jgi:SLT domain-containing protein
MSAFNKTLNNVIKNRTRSSSGGRRPSKSSSEVIISTQNTPTSSNQSNNNSQNFNESSDSTDYEENKIRLRIEFSFISS